MAKTTNDFSSQMITCFGFDIDHDDLEALDEMIIKLEAIPEAKAIMDAYRIECEEQIDYEEIIKHVKLV